MTPDGPARLHNLVARPGISLLVERDGRLPIPLAAHRLTDEPGTGVVAVRPDGYIGFSGDCSDQGLLRSWLALATARSRL